MAQFYNIQLAEIQSFLRQDKGWKQEIQSREIVFSYPLKKFPQIEIKVYSGIRADSGQSRAAGRDAIRACAVNVKTHTGFIKAKRIHRVLGWKENLQNRVLQVIKQAHGRIRERGIN